MEDSDKAEEKSEVKPKEAEEESLSGKMDSEAGERVINKIYINF